jgi:hypothetical protein
MGFFSIIGMATVAFALLYVLRILYETFIYQADLSVYQTPKSQQRRRPAQPSSLCLHSITSLTCDRMAVCLVSE